MEQESSPIHEAASPVDDELLLDWALGQLVSPDREQVERALAGSPQLRQRVDAVHRTLSVLDHCETKELSAGLADRIRSQVAAARRRETIGAGRPSIFSLAEAGAVAAALLLLALVFVPSIRQAQFMRLRLACEANMHQIGVALEHYADSHDRMLPMPNLPANGNWLDREGGHKPTGTAPLFMLVNDRAIALRPADLVCPATKDAAFAGQCADLVDFPDSRCCSYSFQNLFGASKPLMRDSERIVPIVADRNPLFRDDKFCPQVATNSNSSNHANRGQNVLYIDGRVRWESHPEVGVNHHNIWLAGSITTYDGTQTSQGPDDSFLAP